MDVQEHDQIGRRLFTSADTEEFPNVSRWARHVAQLRRMCKKVPEDGFQWTEEVLGDEALTFAKDQNERTLKRLGNPKEMTLYTRILTILDSKEKIPHAGKIGNFFYNFWQDENHKRGIWRRTTWEEYVKKDGSWETVLDIDELGKKESESWVWKGYSLLDEGRGKPKDRALIKISRGGADATVIREFDLTKNDFVSEKDKGFFLPEAKSTVSYKTRDILYVGTDFGPNTLTSSGYPRIMKEWTRGTPLESAKIVHEGIEADVSVEAYRSYENNGNIYDVFSRSLTFYTCAYEFSKNNGKRVPLKLPEDVKLSTHESEFLLKLRKPNFGFPAGSLISTDIDSYVAGKPVWHPLFIPEEGKSSLEGFASTKSTIILVILEDVQSKLVTYIYDEKKSPRWTKGESKGPSIAMIHAWPIDLENSDELWIMESSFLVPSTLYKGDALNLNNGEVQKLKSLPSFFESSNHTVVQEKAISEDGTAIPYFLIKNKNAKGPVPTLLYGYGGFEISLTPTYLSTIGPGWLEKGFNFVFSNIRGGGEFGPTWHQAALKENRKKAYDDFIAIGEKLIKDKITTTPQLGIMGGSNGGLLVGNMFVMRPDLWNAVVCQVPLLDMKRFSHLLAGASWMGEYGNPDEPGVWKEYLHKYSAYHNVDENVKYPAIFLNTSTRDDRVHPSHARKFTALLQSYNNDDTLYYENLEGGHGGAADNTQKAFVKTLEYEFLTKTLSKK